MSKMYMYCDYHIVVRYKPSEPGIIKPVNSWNQWIINFQWNMVEKFTARKVHWFGILDPAHYLPVPVVQSVTLPNSPSFNETYIFEITIKNEVDSWVLGLSNQRKIFGPISDFFTFSATFSFSLTEISAHDHLLPGLNHSKWPGESKFYDERSLNIRWGLSVYYFYVNVTKSLQF